MKNFKWLGMAKNASKLYKLNQLVFDLQMCGLWI